MHLFFVGQGNMGKALALAALAQGHVVSVWNRTAEKCAAAVDAGATRALSLDEGASDCEIMVVCLADAQAVSAVLLPKVVAAMGGKTFVQLSQTTVEETNDLATRALASHMDFLDGSIMGYPTDIAAQRCMIVYSERLDVFDRAQGALTALGGMPRHVGERASAASIFDKAFFSAYYAHLVGFFHGAAICSAANLPLQTYFELMVDHWNWQGPDSIYANMLSAGDFKATEVTLDVHAYAFEKVIGLSKSLNIDHRFPEAAMAAMQDAIEAGRGAEEIAVVAETLQGAKR